MASCPKCGFQAGDGRECPRCGVVFARWRAAAPPAETAPTLALAPATVMPGEEPATAAGLLPRVDRSGWTHYRVGLLLALLALAFPLARAALSGMTVLVHEMGHAAFGWLFGYPSVPAFDFTYGGGVTLQRERSLALVAAVLGAGIFAAYAARARAALRNAALALLALYVPLALSGIHQAIIVAMGHGSELAFATLFLHRALSGRGCTLEAERPLYGLLGWFIALSGAQFAWQLRTSALHRELYEAAKGGGHWMDFSRLAEEFLRVRLEAVAGVFLALCLLPPLLAIAVQRLRRG